MGLHSNLMIIGRLDGAYCAPYGLPLRHFTTHELGYLTLNKEQMNAFFKLMKERYEAGKSTIITTN